MLIFKNPFLTKLFICFDTDGGGTSGTGDDDPNNTTAPDNQSDKGNDSKQLQTEWQNRAAGWQRKFQAEQSEHKVTKDALDSANTKYSDLLKEFNTMKEQNTTLTQSEQQAKTDLGKSNSELDRLKTIMGFPNLIPLMDVLPEGSGEELKTKLTSFNEKILAMTNLSAEEMRRALQDGATPPPPPEDKDKGNNYFDQAKAALMKGDIVEYNRLMDEHYKQKK